MDNNNNNNNNIERSKIDNESSRDTSYFHYYSLLTHQQNMMSDLVRTSTYQNAILQNPQCFQGKTVMDVGAGSGILSFFAVKAGAKVIAVEASNMALKLQKMIENSNPELGLKAKNTWLHGNIKVINKKIEEVTLPQNCVDTIISEPIGVFLVHERMLESFLYARDNFLRPGGAMVPSQGSIFLAPFTDNALWLEAKSKARFWEQSDFYGVDLTPLNIDANDEQFSMPVIGYFDPQSLLLRPNEGFTIDFNTITMIELKKFSIPINWTFNYTGIVHGIASWFDIFFNFENGVSSIMSTSPNNERTHWQQLRLLFKDPIAINIGQSIRGNLYCEVNNSRSYDLVGQFEVYSSENVLILSKEWRWFLQEQTYNYSFISSANDLKPEQMGYYEASN